MNTQLLFLICVLVIIKADTLNCEQPSSDPIRCFSEKSVENKDISLSFSTIIGTLLLLFVSCLANAGGMGGSSMIMSLSLLLFKFNAYSSISHTLLFVFSGSATAISLQIKKNYTSKSRSKLHYDSILLITGPLALGARLGVSLNPVVPESALMALIVVIAIFSLNDLYKKAENANRIRLDQEEKPQLLNESGTAESQLVALLKKVGGFSKVVEIRNPQWKKLDFGESGSEEEWINSIKNDMNKSTHKIELEEEGRWAELGLVVLIVFLAFTTNFGFTLLMKKNAYELGAVWITLGYVGVMILITVGASEHLVSRYRAFSPILGSRNIAPGTWSYSKCAVTCLISTVAGFTVGLLGTGGGNIINPLLLALSLSPETAAVTHSFSVFITSGTAVLQYFIHSSLHLSYCIFLIPVSILGSMLGILYLRKYLLKHDKTHTLLFTLSLLLLLSILIISFLLIQALYSLTL